MEKGSILPSPKTAATQPVHAHVVDEKVKNIPLPSQMPKGLDFSEIPMAAIKSATLEGLITQNEDLMARLSVALRKIHELEEASVVFEREKKSLHTRFQTLREQFLLLEAKDKTTTGRALQQHSDYTKLKQGTDRLEKMYTDLYHQAMALQRRVVLLERYRARIRRVTPVLQEKARRLQELESDAVHFRFSVNAEKIKMAEEFAAQVAQFEQRLAATAQESTALKKSLETEHMQSINHFEAKLAEATQEVAGLRAKADERDRLFDDLLKTQNQLVFEQRQFEQSRADRDQNMARLELENASLRLQLKETLIEREAKTQELTRLTVEIPNLRERNQNLTEQVESLQALWNHKQREIEQQEEKNKSLQKLNQSLSVTLNQQRKEIHQLQVELDKERFSAQEKVKTLIQEIQMLRAQLPGMTGGGEEKL